MRCRQRYLGVSLSELVARELHDTLAQGLVGVTLLRGSTRGRSSTHKLGLDPLTDPQVDEGLEFFDGAANSLKLWLSMD